MKRVKSYLRTSFGLVEVVRSERKTMELVLTKELKLLVRAPYLITDRRILSFLNEKREWIDSHLQQMKKRQQEMEDCGKGSGFEQRLTEEAIRQLAEEAKEVISRRVLYYSERMGISFGRITIRCQKTRWGSCSSKGNLNFNCLLMLTPPEVIDYVVVHELCHRKEMNHSPRFWAEVEKILPDYRKQRLWLKKNGGRVMGRVY